MYENFYELLGVSENASQETIETAYRDTLKSVHPDLNQDDPEAQPKLDVVRIAHDTLSDPGTRDMYDRMTHNDFLSMVDGIPSVSEWTLTESTAETKTRIDYNSPENNS